MLHQWWFRWPCNLHTFQETRVFILRVDIRVWLDVIFGKLIVCMSNVSVLAVKHEDGYIPVCGSVLAFTQWPNCSPSFLAPFLKLRHSHFTLPVLSLLVAPPALDPRFGFCLNCGLANWPTSVGAEGPISWYSSRGMPSGLRREALRVSGVACCAMVVLEGFGRERAARTSEAEGPAMFSVLKEVVVAERVAGG